MQVESTLAVQALAPSVKELRNKHANDPERLQLETAKLYKDANVNPLSGCLPTLATIPVFIGLYRCDQVIKHLAVWLTVILSKRASGASRSNCELALTCSLASVGGLVVASCWLVFIPCSGLLSLFYDVTVCLVFSVVRICSIRTLRTAVVFNPLLGVGL